MPTLEKWFVESSNVRRIKYYEVDKTLEVQFSQGKIYWYFQVPETVFEEMMAAKDINRFFNRAIRGVYEYKLQS